MRIKNKRRFITIFTILGLIILFIIMLSKQSYSKVEISSKTIYVASGDTLWTIAEQEQKNNRYYEDKKIRDILDDIKFKNNLSDSYIYAGQKLDIPTL